MNHETSLDPQNVPEEASSTAPDVTIVIPAFNEEELLPRTLTAIETALGNAPQWSGEVVVVDNNSTDRTAEIARSRGHRVVFEPINQISRARNAGAAAARGRYLIFVDADTVMPVELFQAAMAALAGGKVCGGGAHIWSSDSDTFAATGPMRMWNFLSRLFRVAAGSFIYCRKEGWEAVGGFSKEVYASEELWFSRALKRWGRKRKLRFYILPQAVDTSMRKLEWFASWHLTWTMLQFLFFPWRLRRRECCAMWYDRPEQQKKD